MTDAAAPDLDVHPTAPYSPTPVAPTMTHTEAVSRRDVMISDPATRDKIMQGDVETLAEWNRVIVGLAYGKVPEPAAPDSTEGLVNWALSIAPDLTEAHLQEIKTSQPISSETRRRAEAWKETHFRDPGFVEKWSNGDVEVHRQIFHLNTLLSLPVRDRVLAESS